MTRITPAWLDASPTRAVVAAFAAQGCAVYFVGGCVRNALIGAADTDIDLATPAPPETVIALAGAAGLKTVPTGLKHGTVTLVVDGQPFEATTFRRDVATDGRHAEVAFADRLEEDAARRDFTMNALYARPDGTVIDPVGGVADLHARRLRFIGDAAARVAEDYLRILRYFRFFAWYADPEHGFDADALAACAGGLDGLARVSAERIGHEMRKLLAAPDPVPTVGAMAQTGVLARVLPGAGPETLAPLVALEACAGAASCVLRRLAALGGADPADALRLSRAETARLRRLRDGVSGDAGPGELAYRHDAATARDVTLLRAAVRGGDVPPDLEAAIARGADARFPVRAADLPDHAGPALGRRLAALEAAWIASDFALGKDALLALPETD